MQLQVGAKEVIGEIFAAQTQSERLTALRQISDYFDADQNLEEIVVSNQHIKGPRRDTSARNISKFERSMDLSADEFTLNRCVNSGDIEQVIKIFSDLSDLPRNSVKLLFISDEPDLLLFVSRALNLAYSTVRALFALRSRHAQSATRYTPDEDFIRDWNERISIQKASRILRFVSFRLHAKHQSRNFI